MYFRHTTLHDAGVGTVDVNLRQYRRNSGPSTSGSSSTPVFCTLCEHLPFENAGLSGGKERKRRQQRGGEPGTGTIECHDAGCGRADRPYPRRTYCAHGRRRAKGQADVAGRRRLPPHRCRRARRRGTGSQRLGVRESQPPKRQGGGRLRDTVQVPALAGLERRSTGGAAPAERQWGHQGLALSSGFRRRAATANALRALASAVATRKCATKAPAQVRAGHRLGRVRRRGPGCSRRDRSKQLRRHARSLLEPGQFAHKHAPHLCGSIEALATLCLRTKR